MPEVETKGYRRRDGFDLSRGILPIGIVVVLVGSVAVGAMVWQRTVSRVEAIEKEVATLQEEKLVLRVGLLEQSVAAMTTSLTDIKNINREVLDTLRAMQAAK